MTRGQNYLGLCFGLIEFTNPKPLPVTSRLTWHGLCVAMATTIAHRVVSDNYIQLCCTLASNKNRIKVWIKFLKPQLTVGILLLAQ